MGSSANSDDGAAHLIEATRGAFTDPANTPSGDPARTANIVVGADTFAGADAIATDGATITVADDEQFLGGGMQNGRSIHTGATINIARNFDWDDDGYPNAVPYNMASSGYGYEYQELPETVEAIQDQTEDVLASDLEWLSATNGYGSIGIDVANLDPGQPQADGKPLTSNHGEKKVFEKGLGVHANGRITYYLEDMETEKIDIDLTGVELGNPLATDGAWTTAGGRQWRTECNTPATGGNGCRSYLWTSVVAGAQRADGTWSYAVKNTWVFNNIVRFS